jgi:hypothetical protein
MYELIPSLVEVETFSASCPALCRASTSLVQCSFKDVDGRDEPDEPGHDDLRSLVYYGAATLRAVCQSFGYSHNVPLVNIRAS